MNKVTKDIKGNPKTYSVTRKSGIKRDMGKKNMGRTEDKEQDNRVKPTRVNPSNVNPDRRYTPGPR